MKRSLVDSDVASGTTHNDDRFKVLFKDVPFRTFSFTFKLIPKSATEHDAIILFMDRMKLKSAPLKISDTRWGFPTTFQIDFVDGNHRVMMKTLELACTNVTVNYTPEGIWAQTKDGRPTHYEFSLEFMELEQITQKEILEGA